MMFLNFIALLSFFVVVKPQFPCTLPKDHVMEIFSLEDGQETLTTIKAQSLKSSKNQLDGLCYSITNTTNPLPESVTDIGVIFQNMTNNCYFCYRFILRSLYVMQYSHTQCQSLTPYLCSSLANPGFDTGFLKGKSQQLEFNCKSIIEGIYQFNYKLTRYTGVCDRPSNMIKACQKQGSPLRDNNIFTMKFDFCPTINPAESRGDIKYIPYDFTWKCYGRWVDPQKNIWGAIEFDTNEEKFRYRCIQTRIDQQDPTKQTWGISSDANCRTLESGINNAPIRIEAKRAFDPDIQIREMEPGCKLPTNFTGIWFYPSEFNTEVKINSTHIYWKRRIDQTTYDEIYFVCRQFQENRYLMATVTKGKCNLDFTCFHFLPRHHNIIRFRMGRPFRMNDQDRNRNPADYMNKVFRESCHWNSFTLNYVDWVYEYFILDPPVPVNCPIQGRYMFKQIGQKEELYYTKMPDGMTPRPRLQVLCDGKWESDLAACYENPKQLNLDVERCMRLDFNGRPISEYDIADNRLTCVGYWMEDTKSFLITYDPEDPVVHNFRCWVYRRMELSYYKMSRSQGSHCSKIQTADSSGPETGASLLLELQQNELEFDACPMSFDDGTNPYANPSVFNVYSHGHISEYSHILLILLSISIYFYSLSN